jgi:transcriptional regulator with XRE-family HTH domain
MTTVTIGQQLRARRLELGLTLDAVAARTDHTVTPTCISKLERADGGRYPNLATIEALCRALDINVFVTARATTIVPVLPEEGTQ